MTAAPRAILLVWKREHRPLGVEDRHPPYWASSIPTAGLRVDNPQPHAESWADTSWDGAVCGACRQPWPCDTPDAVEPGSRRWIRAWTPDAIVLAWDGEIERAGCDAADWLLYDALTHPIESGPEVRCVTAARMALAGDEAALGWLESRFDPVGEIIALSEKGKEVADAG